MSFQAAYIKDALKRIEEKVDKLSEKLEQKQGQLPVDGGVSTAIVGGLTEMQQRMARVRAAKKVNTGQEGRG